MTTGHTNCYLTESLEELISLANSINKAHEDSVSIGKALLAESPIVESDASNNP